MSEQFPHLFQPLRVGALTLKNRFMNTGHAAHFQTGDGIPTEKYVHYLRERAKGGAGIIVTGHTVTHFDGDVALSLASYDDRIVEIYKRMAGGTHEFDVPLLAQLGHRGRRVSDSAGFLRRPMMAPSAVPAPDFSAPIFVPHEMSTDEVEAVVESFAAAAARARRGNLDGIEISIGMDYLFPNFLHPHGNRREDKYGGATLDERMTFLREVLAAARAELGRERLIGVRMYDDLVDYSMQIEDYVELARFLAKDGSVDYFNMWQGIVPSGRSGRVHWPSYYYKPGQFVHLPAAVKAVTSLPVVGTGRMDSPAVAERTIAEGKADIIGMARTLIADPHFPNKVRAGAIDDIRPCIACTQSCVGHIYLGLGVGCIYNPVTGREEEWGTLDKAARPGRILVVGGGPAGLEAARVAALRGHKVTLIERGTRLGGQVNLAMRTPNRGNFEEIILFFERQLKKLGVEIRLRTEAEADSVLAEGADAIVIATGSTAWLPEVAGIDGPNVFSARDVLAGTAQLGPSVLVVDTVGRAEAATTADFLADRGHRVELVTGLAQIASEMPVPARHNLLEKLMTSSVTLTTYTGIWEVGPGGVEAYNVVTWQPRTIDGVDSVVFASGGKADDALYRALRGRHPSVHQIGDCYQARDIEVAVVDGHRVAREL
jgi:2,4-dienoyl-CoA reductase-like NADH-dependent reductase (Old Yellow Enzyme family)